jgi:hypothetical protein
MMTAECKNQVLTKAMTMNRREQCDNNIYDDRTMVTILVDPTQLRNDLLWLSSGLVDLSKCSFHHIHFDFMPDGTAMMRAGKFGAPLQVHDESKNTCMTIPAKSAYQSHKTLGHHKAPRGKYDPTESPSSLFRLDCKAGLYQPL